MVRVFSKIVSFIKLMSILQVLVEHNTKQQNANYIYIYIPSVSLIGTVIDDDFVNIVSQA